MPFSGSREITRHTVSEAGLKSIACRLRGQIDVGRSSLQALRAGDKR